MSRENSKPNKKGRNQSQKENDRDKKNSNLCASTSDDIYDEDEDFINHNDQDKSNKDLLSKSKPVINKNNKTDSSKNFKSFFIKQKSNCENHSRDYSDKKLKVKKIKAKNNKKEINDEEYDDDNDDNIGIVKSREVSTDEKELYDEDHTDLGVDDILNRNLTKLPMCKGNIFKLKLGSKNKINPSFDNTNENESFGELYDDELFEIDEEKNNNDMEIFQKSSGKQNESNDIYDEDEELKEYITKENEKNYKVKRSISEKFSKLEFPMKYINKKMKILKIKEISITDNLKRKIQNMKPLPMSSKLDNSEKDDELCRDDLNQISEEEPEEMYGDEDNLEDSQFGSNDLSEMESSTNLNEIKHERGSVIINKGLAKSEKSCDQSLKLKFDLKNFKIKNQMKKKFWKTFRDKNIIIMDEVYDDDIPGIEKEKLNNSVEIDEDIYDDGETFETNEEQILQNENNSQIETVSSSEHNFNENEYTTKPVVTFFNQKFRNLKKSKKLISNRLKLNIQTVKNISKNHKLSDKIENTEEYESDSNFINKMESDNDMNNVCSINENCENFNGSKIFEASRSIPNDMYDEDKRSNEDTDSLRDAKITTKYGEIRKSLTFRKSLFFIKKRRSQLTNFSKNFKIKLLKRNKDIRETNNINDELYDEDQNEINKEENDDEEYYDDDLLQEDTINNETSDNIQIELNNRYGENENCNYQNNEQSSDRSLRDDEVISEKNLELHKPSKFKSSFKYINKKINVLKVKEETLSNHFKTQIQRMKQISRKFKNESVTNNEKCDSDDVKQITQQFSDKISSMERKCQNLEVVTKHWKVQLFKIKSFTNICSSSTEDFKTKIILRSKSLESTFSLMKHISNSITYINKVGQRIMIWNKDLEHVNKDKIDHNIRSNDTIIANNKSQNVKNNHVNRKSDDDSILSKEKFFIKKENNILKKNKSEDKNIRNYSDEEKKLFKEIESENINLFGDYFQESDKIDDLNILKSGAIKSCEDKTNSNSPTNKDLNNSQNIGDFLYPLYFQNSERIKDSFSKDIFGELCDDKIKSLDDKRNENDKHSYSKSSKLYKDGLKEDQTSDLKETKKALKRRNLTDDILKPDKPAVGFHRSKSFPLIRKRYNLKMCLEYFDKAGEIVDIRTEILDNNQQMISITLGGVGQDAIFESDLQALFKTKIDVKNSANHFGLSKDYKVNYGMVEENKINNLEINKKLRKKGIPFKVKENNLNFARKSLRNEGKSNFKTKPEIKSKNNEKDKIVNSDKHRNIGNNGREIFFEKKGEENPEGFDLSMEKNFQISKPSSLKHLKSNVVTPLKSGQSCSGQKSIPRKDMNTDNTRKVAAESLKKKTIPKSKNDENKNSTENISHSSLFSNRKNEIKK